MKNILYKILFTFLIVFSYIFVNATEINPEYEKYLKLSDTLKSEVSYVPNEYINYYEVKNNSSRNFTLGLYGSSLSSYDLRNVNGERLIPEVKDQNPLELCWAFATNNMIESYFLKEGKTYNLSENHLDYVGRYFKDTSVFGQPNSFYNVIKYLFEGYGPFSEDVFGSYFTSYKNKSYNSYLDYDNTLFDVNKLVVLPALRSSYIKENKSAVEIKSYFSTYNQIIKEHLMNYGAIASGIYWDFYDSSTNMVYNDNSLSYEEYSDSGHAITIIGWDDNYGSVNIKGTTFTGSWLAMNSWGNQIQYFYISYYDENVVQSLVGIEKINEKKWDNVYLDNNEIESSTKKVVYEFQKENKSENINSVKLFFRDDNDKFVVKVSDGYNTYTSQSDGNVTFGINTFEFKNVTFDSDKVYVIIESTEGNMEFDVALYTSSNINSNRINIIEDKTSMYSTLIKHKIISRGIDTGEVYNIKVYDQDNKDITSLFVDNSSMVINDISNLELIVMGDISYSNYIKIVASNSGLSDEIILYRTPSGSKNDPFIIRTSSDMSYLSNNSYFELGNDIDMKRDTTNIYGLFYNSGNGWQSINFSGHLDGKGFKISNLNSKNGSLFNSVNSSSIKNIAFDNFNISDINNNGSYSGIINSFSNSSVISNVLINNSIFNCSKTFCGMLVGNMLDGNIENVHIINSSVSGSNVSYLVSNVNNPVNQINIKNVFVNDSSLSNNNSNLINTININSNVSGLRKIEFSNNIVNGSDSSKNLILNKNITISDNASYDIHNEKFIISNNYIKNDNQVLDENIFVNFDKKVWSFDNIKSLYLSVFSDIYFTSDEDKLIFLNNYLIKDNVIYNVNSDTNVASFLNNITNKDNFDIKVYSSNNSLIANSSLISTGSYIDVSFGGNTQRYYIMVTGDVNSDGKLSIFDIVKINNHIVYNDKKLVGIYAIAADYNGDDDVSIFDIVKINNKILGGN